MEGLHQVEEGFAPVGGRGGGLAPGVDRGGGLAPSGGGKGEEFAPVVEKVERFTRGGGGERGRFALSGGGGVGAGDAPRVKLLTYYSR